MTADRNHTQRCRVVVVIGDPGPILVDSLRAVGLAPIAAHDDIAIWTPPGVSAWDHLQPVADGGSGDAVALIADRFPLLGLDCLTVEDLLSITQPGPIRRPSPLQGCRRTRRADQQ